MRYRKALLFSSPQTLDCPAIKEVSLSILESKILWLPLQSVRWLNFMGGYLIIFLGSKITADGDCSHEIKRRLLLGRKVMTNLDSILKSRDITLPTKVRLVKALVFPVVMYGCELDCEES